MKYSWDLSSMYSRHSIYLWVEDNGTRAYLQTLWANQNPPIGFYTAGGHEHIESIIKSAHADFCTHVFGLRDRDFSEHNRDQWNAPGLRVFVGERVEVENYLLDAEAIAKCEVNTSGLSADQIENELKNLAQPLVWWMSCRATISQIRLAVLEQFPEHPSRKQVTDFTSAKNAISSSTWWRDVLPHIHARWGFETRVEQSLTDNEERFRQMLADGSWKKHFSGKEILKDLLTKVWTRRRPPDPDASIQFIEEIAKVQRTNPPGELVELREALLKRIGR